MNQQKLLAGIFIVIGIILSGSVFGTIISFDDFENNTYYADSYDPDLGVNDQWIDTDGDGSTDIETSVIVGDDDGGLTVRRIIPLHYPGTNYSYSAINRVANYFTEQLDISDTEYITFLIKDSYLSASNSGPTNTENKLSMKLFTTDATWQSQYLDIPQDDEWYLIVFDLSSFVNIDNYKPEITMDEITGYSFRFTKSGECEIKDMNAVSFYESTFPVTNGTLLTNAKDLSFFYNIPLTNTDYETLIQITNFSQSEKMGYIAEYEPEYLRLNIRLTNDNLSAGDFMKVSFSPLIGLDSIGLTSYPVISRDFEFYYNTAGYMNLSASNVSLCGDIEDITDISADDNGLSVKSDLSVFPDDLSVVWFSRSEGQSITNQYSGIIPDYDEKHGLYKFNIHYSGDYWLSETAPSTASVNLSLKQNPFTPNNDGIGDELEMIVSVSTSGRLKVTAVSKEGWVLEEILDEEVPAGEIGVSWDGRSDGDLLMTGIYFVVVEFTSESRITQEATAVMLCR